MRVTFYTLGCKVNQNETGALAQLFEENGYTVVSNEEPADVYVVNSCTVTNFGDQKSRKWLRRAKRENPGAVTVLTGCYPQAFPEEAAEIKEADVVTGSGNRHAILADVTRVLNGEDERVVDIRPHRKGEKFEELPMDKFAEHTRAFVKVEDGCNRQCAYCVIPRARGPVRSRDEESILEELRRLAAAGYKEVVLTAISLPSYGTDSGTSLVELIEKAAEVEGIERIRLGSLDPDMLHDEVITRMAAVKKLCPQFHLSLQSGCDKTLRAMRRPYTTAQYADIAAKLRAAFGAENVSFTTDVIVGFPGETEEDFEASMAFVTGTALFKGACVPLLPPRGYSSLRLSRPAAGARERGPQPPHDRRCGESACRRGGRHARSHRQCAAGNAAVRYACSPATPNSICRCWSAHRGTRPVTL